jgi:hypothetical protein
MEEVVQKMMLDVGIPPEIITCFTLSDMKPSVKGDKPSLKSGPKGELTLFTPSSILPLIASLSPPFFPPPFTLPFSI